MADAEKSEQGAYNSPDFQFIPASPTLIGESLPAKVGEPAPDFEAVTLEAKPFRLSDLRGKYVVIATGAVTSPMCAFEVPAYNRMQDEFAASDVGFYLLYTRESHCAENYGPHESLEHKVDRARELQRLENVKIPIIVDDVEGTVHRKYGPWPSALFVIDREGQLVYRSNMANSKELKQLLEDLLFAEEAVARGEIMHTEYSERIIPHLADRATHRRIYERAGPSAFEEGWRRRPHLRNKWP